MRQGKEKKRRVQTGWLVGWVHVGLVWESMGFDWHSALAVATGGRQRYSIRVYRAWPRPIHIAKAGSRNPVTPSTAQARDVTLRLQSLKSRLFLGFASPLNPVS